MTTDFTLTPLQILVALINATNATSLTTSDITFGAVSVLTEETKNTAVTITAVANSGYTGTRDLTYDRIDFADVPGSRSKEFVKGSATHVVDLIPAINAAYQLNLQVGDYVNSLLPTFDGLVPHDMKPFNLTAAAGSYIFIGEIELTLDGNDVDLADLITTTELEGLSYPVY